jgi:hypothetical protein
MGAVHGRTWIRGAAGAVTTSDGRASKGRGLVRLLVGGAAVGLVAIIAITIASGKKVARSVDNERVEVSADAAAAVAPPSAGARQD